MDKLDSIVTQLGLDGFDKFEPLQKVAQKIGLKRPAYIVFGFIVLSVVCIAVGVLDSILTNVIGVIYPTYKSIQAVESQVDVDDKQWLSYWIIFSILTTLDTYFGFFLRFIPLYNLVKLAFLICLFHPKVNGATIIYDKVIQPFYQNNKDKIEKTINEFEQKAYDKFKN